MKNLQASIVAALAVGVALVVWVPVSVGQDDASLAVSLTPESELWIEGGSTLHDWEARTKESTLTLFAAPGTASPTTLAEFEAMVRSSTITGLALSVPVLTMKSGKGGLDKKLYKTLETDDHPTIDWTLDSYTFVDASADADTMRIQAIGTLTVSGVSRPDTLEARLFADEAGLWLEGTHELRMTSFEIKPPKMMFGTLRTHDDFTVFYKLHMIPGEAPVDVTQDSSNGKES